jgi:osmoprotectant transport system substrate-binding protein
MRLNRAGAIGAMLLAGAMIAAACSSGGGSTSTSTTAAAGAKPTVASQLVMGGPPECSTRITCLVGLQTIYGLKFKDFKPLDEVGPISVQALDTNQVQVVRLNSSDPAILQKGWVILTDDKHFELPGNLIPIIRTAKATPDVKTLLNKVSSTMTQDDLLGLDTKTAAHQDPSDVAAQYVKDKLAGTSTPGTKGSITIGSAAFAEDLTVAYVYADVLKGAGYTVNVKPNLGNREIYEPALESGQIDLLPEYAGNYLSFLNKNAGILSLDQTVTQLQALLTPKSLTALTPSNANDADAIVVTKATAAKYSLVKISDLGNPAP